MSNSTRDEDVHTADTADYVLFAGSAVSLISILLTLIVYVANRGAVIVKQKPAANGFGFHKDTPFYIYLRVKRQHMITINLCVSLLVFYVGFIIVLSADTKRRLTTTTLPPSTECLAGSVLVLFGWFYSHSWLLTHWIFLCMRIQRSALRHISNFFIKICLFTYVPASIVPIVIVVYDSAKEHEFLNKKHCFYDLGDTLGLGFGIITGFLFVGITFCSVFCIARLTCWRNPFAVHSTLKKNRGALVRLFILTLIILFTHIPHFVMWIVKSRSNSAHHELEVVDGIFVGLHGILIVICLLYRGDRFCNYWSTAVHGRNPTSNVRMSRMNTTSMSSKRGVSTTTSEYVPDESSNDRRIEPRDGKSIVLTVDDEVFLSGNTQGATKADSAQLAQNNDEKSPNNNNGSPGNTARARLDSIRRKVLRASMRKSNKSSVSSVTSPPTTPNYGISTLNRFQFRESTISTTNGDPERKTSF